MISELSLPARTQLASLDLGSVTMGQESPAASPIQILYYRATHGQVLLAQVLHQLNPGLRQQQQHLVHPAPAEPPGSCIAVVQGSCVTLLQLPLRYAREQMLSLL